MAESRFIKTVAFGGYEKTEVIRKLEYLNSQVFDLKNELRETKLLLESYKKGTDSEKANENIIAGERAKLTQIQVQNETLTTKLKATEEENKSYEQQIKELKSSIEELEKNLKTTKDDLVAAKSGGNAAAISSVFIEAQKSSDMLMDNAKKEAARIEEAAKKVAEITIEDANDEAAQIIFEAESEAAVRIAGAKNSSEEIMTSSNNIKALMLDDVTKLISEMNQFRTIFEKFVKSGLDDIGSAEEKLSTVEATLKENGVPVFKVPEYYEPAVPEQPKRNAMKKREDEEALKAEKQKTMNELDKLKQMAAALGSTKPDSQESKEKNNRKVDLSALAAQASALKDKK